MYPKETSLIFISLLIFGSITAYYYLKKVKIYASLRLEQFNALQKKILEGLNGFRDIKIKKEELKLEYLSLGMSSDYIEALKFKSDFLRIGTNIFGPRN